MKISKIINFYSRNRSPYTKRGLVNHLPMGQLALYQMTNNVEKIDRYSKEYIEEIEVPFIEEDYRIASSMEECLGKRESYGPCLNLINEKLKKENPEDLIRYILNTYPLGMSSGLFHTIIRLGYAVEGYKLDGELVEELARALAYYITAYKKADVFTKKISKEEFIESLVDLEEDSHIRKIVRENETLGTKLRALYRDKFYMEEGVIIDGNEAEKIRTLLIFLIRGFNNTGNIVSLHCITSVHALFMLKEYFDDFNGAIDILTTTIITHLITLDRLDIEDRIGEISQQSWECIMSKASESENIHAIKLTYSGYILDSEYDVPELKESALKRIRRK